ncbi:MAG: 3-dehydroquinate synthase [Gammaproteobacteria bacterium]|nr:3-dehydroquinate synthase [Gammaproteobacteria bacterium]
MKTLCVDLGKHSYPIYIGENLLRQSQLVTKHTPSQQLLIVTNETIAPLYLDTVLSTLSHYHCKTVILPDGEQYKNIDTLNLIYDALLENRFERQCTLIALGGGVVGDMTGFAAASYQRGVNFIQMPTTLLAQVDSSVGGKTGVNHPLGKNMIGAFHQPRCVIADTTTLNTLNERELSAGIAEVIKYGVIRDAEFFKWLSNNIPELLTRNPQCLSYAIDRACQNKAEVVAADEREAGERALLNFGHTFGHAIEAGMGYGAWLHGEAVATGMVLAADLSRRHQWIDDQQFQQIKTLIKRANLPIQAPTSLSIKRFLELMSVDKKVKQGKINLVLLKSLGKAIISDDYDPQLLYQSLQQSIEHT